METHETQGDYLGLMRFFILIKTKGTHETQRDSEGLKGLRRLRGTHETQKDYCRLMRLLILIKTDGDS